MSTAAQMGRLHAALRANGCDKMPDTIEECLDTRLGMGRKRKREVEPSMAQTIRTSMVQRLEQRLARLDKRLVIQLCNALDKDTSAITPSEASSAAAQEAVQKLLT